MKKVLYIERSKMFQMIIRKIVEENGGYAFVTSSGQEGLDILSKEKIDFIITAYIYDDMNAEKLIKSLNTDIPVILISSYDEIKDVKSFFKLGISDYILKKDLKEDESIETILDLLK